MKFIEEQRKLNEELTTRLKAVETKIAKLEKKTKEKKTPKS